MLKRKIILAQSNDDILNEFSIPLKKRSSYFENNEEIVIPTYFYRYIGYEDTIEKYFKEISIFEKKLYRNYEDIIFKINYSDFEFGFNIENEIIENWNIIDKNYEFSNLNLFDSINFENILVRCLDIKFKKDIVDSLKSCYVLFLKNKKAISKTIAKNFVLKQIILIKKYFNKIRKSLIDNEEIHKVLFYGEIKEFMVYYLIFLNKIGFDILYINTDKNNAFNNINLNEEYLHSKVLNNTYSNPDYENKINRNIFIIDTEKRNGIKKNNIVNVKKTNIDSKINTKKFKKYDFDKILNRKYSESKTKNYEELAQLSISVVLIKTYDFHGNMISGGSGVVITDDGVIATANHILDNCSFIKVLFENSRDNIGYETYTILFKDKNRDMALIKINKNTKKIDICLKNGSVKRGQKIVSIGSPLGLMNTFGDGIVSGFRDFGKLKFIQNTAPSSPGSSGGALLNEKGELIGIIAGDFVAVSESGFLKGQNLNISIDIIILIELLKDRNVILNYSMIKNFSEYKYNDKKFIFDGFFDNGYQEISEFSFQQNRQDKNDLFSLIKQNETFKKDFENYYKNEIPKFLKQFNVINFSFEIGIKNISYKISYDNGILSNEKWNEFNI
jgi:hypothetical protein